MSKIVGVAGGMYTIATSRFGYAVGTAKLSVCSAIGVVTDGMIAFMHLAPINATMAPGLLRDVVDQMAEYRELAKIPGRPDVKRVYGLQGGSEAFDQILMAPKSLFPQAYQALPPETYTYTPTFRGFTLDPSTGEVSKPPADAFQVRHPRVVTLSDARYGVLQRLYDEGQIR